jgi:hypothetical protein
MSLVEDSLALTSLTDRGRTTRNPGPASGPRLAGDTAAQQQLLERRPRQRPPVPGCYVYAHGAIR